MVYVIIIRVAYPIEEKNQGQVHWAPPPASEDFPTAGENHHIQ